MRSPPASPRPLSRRVRSVAFLLLVVQALIAASPFYEPRNVADLPRIHMEQKDATHVDLHNEHTCAVCSARTVFVVLPGPACPLIDAAGRQALVAATAAGLAPSADVRVGPLSRAPPSLSA
ncbi:MAG: hypothetical protein ACYC3L_13825 [Gemmatimonadaceae bacterium]